MESQAETSTFHGRTTSGNPLQLGSHRTAREARVPLPSATNKPGSRAALRVYSLHSLPCAQANFIGGGAEYDELCSPKERHHHKALHVHREFQECTALLDSIKACGKQKDLFTGCRLHADILKRGLLKRDLYVGTALLCMYAKCGALAKAREVFDELPAPDVASWNALITGYAQHGLCNEALNCFQQMQQKGLPPDAVTFVGILKACSSIGAVEKGKEIHMEIGRQGLLRNNILLGTALVDMYAKCGAHVKAQEVFDELPVRDIVSWNALMAGYAQHGLGDEGLECFRRMREEGFSPNAVTFVCTLKACSSIGAARMAEEIHAEVRKQRLLWKHVVLGNTLVDMYAKCGALAKAQKVFDELPTRDTVSWNALIAGYSQLGYVRRVFGLFSKMTRGGTLPSDVTFVVLLTACSHAGLVQEGQMYFDTMSTVYGITPTLEHHKCLVDLFSRAGHFDKAIRVIEKVPPSDCLVLWSALMGACREWVNVDLGRWVFDQVVELDEKFASGYVCMSNIYAFSGMQEEGQKV